MRVLSSAALDELEVAEHELGLDQLDVGQRVDALAHVRDFRVVEGAHHVRHGVDAADVGEEAVAQALAAAGALGQPGDVDDVDGGVDLPRRLQDLVQPVEALVGHGDHAQVGLRRGEGVRGRRRAGVREGVEERGLADVGQTDDAELHGLSPEFAGEQDLEEARELARAAAARAPGTRSSM